AAGLVSGLASNSTASAASGAQSGRNAVENNYFGPNGMPKGMTDVGMSMTSLYTNTNLLDENGNVLNPITEEERQYAMHRLVTGVMPEGQDISKAIVNGYTNGVLIAGAWYIGPAAALGKVVVGSVLSGGANAAYQWYDLSQPNNKNKTYDYWSTTAALVTGGLAPGRNILPNVGIAMGSAVFTDGPNIGAIGSAAAGSWAGGAFGKYAPVGVEKIMGNDKTPGFVFDVVGSLGSEFLGGYTKDLINAPAQNGTQEEKKENDK
ncbi:VENN motif pre-toxin domain-containing protein, partial [Pectobacterium peruviense]|uniref:VENN motif pre-toxin domain-containing protein n=1 Tax=Pectobacterium peruviense TaxID=2066479 RepID=UPI0016711003